ncbi:hypothetical protein BBBOND_0306830 [Babesia bigemina]|uniref:Uncharacterized protein n=1 Tax=Babesia bigemina TaxID=5866 RepID=A0A061DCL7_BABBI|nr:hypothetical protein BBBOND_0306830 [Babesia bigemina]CDR96779.1 hypothetical protein BBBOND_0306830 [Babesia bigemina]|eukprot:XP_012768965.1 hypothetical protein BBBOND_0306830 [Babesia bigemina]
MMDKHDSGVTNGTDQDPAAHKRPADALLGDPETTALAPTRTLKTQGGVRVYTHQPSSGLEKKSVHIDRPETTSSELDARLEAGSLNKTAEETPTAIIDIPKERFDICIQTADPCPQLIEDNSATEHATSPNDELGLPALSELPNDIREVLEAVSSTLEELSQAVKRLESTQKVILRRVKRKSSYNQFFLD